MELNLSCIIKGAIAVIFGLLALALPEQTLGTFGYLFGAFIIAGIVIFMFLATTSPGDESALWLGLSFGFVLIGVVSIFIHEIVALVFLFIVAGVAFYSGLSDITYALEHPKTKYFLIGGTFLMGVILLGVLIRFFPVTIAPTAAMIPAERFIFTALGSFALVFGLCSVLMGVYPTPKPITAKSWDSPAPKGRTLTFGDGVCNLYKKKK